MFGDNQFTGTYPDKDQVAGVDLVIGTGAQSSKMLKILEPKPTNSDPADDLHQPRLRGTRQLRADGSRFIARTASSPRAASTAAPSRSPARTSCARPGKRPTRSTLSKEDVAGTQRRGLQLQQLKTRRLITTLRHDQAELQQRAYELKQDAINAPPCDNPHLSKGLHTWNKSTIDTCKVEAFATDFLRSDTLRVANPSKPFHDQHVLNGMCVVQLTERVKYSEDTMSGDDGNIRWANRMMRSPTSASPVAIMLVTPSAKPRTSCSGTATSSASRRAGEQHRRVLASAIAHARATGSPARPRATRARRVPRSHLQWRANARRARMGRRTCQ